MNPAAVREILERARAQARCNRCRCVSRAPLCSRCTKATRDAERIPPQGEAY